MKKILGGITALALLALVAGPALANCPPLQASVCNDHTLVKNNVVAQSFTGNNGIANSQNQKGGFGGNISSGNDNNTINTGNATAYAGAANMVNSNLAMSPGCCGPKVQVSAGNDFTKVVNNVEADAVTGYNGIANSQNQMGGFGGDISSNNDNNRIITGDATAMAGAANLVNSNVGLTGCCATKYQVSAGNDWTGVRNNVLAISDTGGNVIAGSENKKGGFCEGMISSNNDGNTVNTGNAVSAAGAITIVNSNIKRSAGGGCPGGMCSVE